MDCSVFKNFNVFYSSEASFTSHDLILIAEAHRHDQEEIGGLISELARSQVDGIDLFLEGVPSMEGIRIEEVVRSDQIARECFENISCFGWDARGLGEKVGLSSGEYEFLQEEMAKTLQLKLNCIDDMEKLVPGSYVDEDLDESELMTCSTETLQKLLEMQKRLSQIEAYYQECKEEAKKGLATREQIKATFQERTSSMVSSLEEIRKRREESTESVKKVVLIAGAAHLIPIYSEGEYDLQRLYDELKHHKAIILIPKSVDLHSSCE